MKDRNELYSFGRYGFHKGFYNDESPAESLMDIQYTDFWEYPEDDEFPYYNAYSLLCGSCHLFALALQKIFNYNAYIIEEKCRKGFHAFCQIYVNRKWYYVDARGITSSFDEFMDIAKTFVTDEYIIRPIEFSDIEEWNVDDNYTEEGLAFAEAVIRKYKECYEFV